MIQKIVFVLFIIGIVVLLGRNLNPFSPQFFTFHDLTQVARVQEFTYSLKSFQIPPRIAPHFSFEMGYPVFNFYAPFTYLFAGLLGVIGIGAVVAIKISLLICLLIAFISMYVLLRQFFSFYAALLGASLYVSSPWIATELVTRGNFGEIWFFALLPLTLYLLYKNARSKSFGIFASTVVISSCIFTTHNIFSLLSIPLLFTFSIIIKNPKKNIFALIWGLLIASYFLIPALLESSFVSASQIAKMTYFGDHFLCLNQIWNAPYFGYGGSAPGCFADGMSFAIGKLVVIAGLIGSGFFMYSLLKNKVKGNGIVIYFFIVACIGLFMTLPPSLIIWQIFSFIQLFQFPWRFLIFVLFGASFLSAYGAHKTRLIGMPMILTVVSFICIANYSKYFYRNNITVSQFNENYLSKEYIETKAAYEIPEYLPKGITQKEWRNIHITSTHFIKTFDSGEIQFIHDDGFTKIAKTNSKKIQLQVFFSPQWKIRIDEKQFVPNQFDTLKQPVIELDGKLHTITLMYTQTYIELISNWIALISLGILLLGMTHKRFQLRVKEIIT
jgi:hypothetical protein